MTIAVWVQAARPKTLSASLCPVMIGFMLAMRDGFFHFPTIFFTFLAALGIQIGTNLANDYFDFVKGADTSNRKGPVRVTQAGLVSPTAMKQAIFICFFLTALFCCFLVYRGGIYIALLSMLSLTLGLAYTAGPYPLAYLGLGDLFVFLFFGPIATAGTYYLQAQHFSFPALFAGIGPGLLSVAILTVNNLRDIQEDLLARKRTLCVRFGKRFGQYEYLSAILLAALTLTPLLSFVFLIPATPLIRAVFKAPEPQAFNPLLQKTSLLLFLFTALFFFN